MGLSVACVRNKCAICSRDNQQVKHGIYPTCLNLDNDCLKGEMMLIVLIILLLLAFGAFPTWPYSRSWGYYPSGGLGLILLIVLIVALFNHGL